MVWGLNVLGRIKRLASSHPTRFTLALSLGPDCRAAYQLKRHLPSLHQSSIFDWQITPTAALIAYLDRDFRDLYRVSDLSVAPGGVVVHSELRTEHYHEFPKDLAGTAEMLAGYPKALSRHNYLCAKTRRLLSGSDECLLAMSGPPRDGLTHDHIAAALRRFNPRLRFVLLDAPTEVEPISRADEDWRGNEEIWRRHLDAAVGRLH